MWHWHLQPATLQIAHFRQNLAAYGKPATSNNTSDHEFDTHTYLCSGNIGGFRGDCYIRVMHDNFIVHNNHHLTLSGETMPFEFTFAPEWGDLDRENLNFIVEVLDYEGNTLCKTTVVARHN